MNTNVFKASPLSHPFFHDLLQLVSMNSLHREFCIMCPLFFWHRLFLLYYIQYVVEMVKAGKNIFFTGGAGTGKSFLINKIIGNQYFYLYKSLLDFTTRQSCLLDYTTRQSCLLDYTTRQSCLLDHITRRGKDKSTCFTFLLIILFSGVLGKLLIVQTAVYTDSVQ